MAIKKGGRKSAGGGESRRGDKRQDETGGAAAPSPPELIVVARPEAALRTSAGRFESLAGAPTDSLATLLADNGVSLRPLFGATEERVLSMTASLSAESGTEPFDLSLFYSVDAAPDRLESVRSDLAADDLVDGAYIKPGAEPAAFLNDMAPASEEAPPASPDFSSRQLYLDAAPGGVEARWAWTQAGGGGNTIRIIDIEGEWRFTHEDLTGNQGGMVGGNPANNIIWRNHGTAVIGEFGGDRNSFGITGISPDATVSAISIFGPGSAGAINLAATKLGAGDVLLIELHRPGPRFNFASRADQRGYVAIEWWPDDFAALRAAANKGIIVVEAAGNGAENLDDAIYQNPAPGFPAGWTNPFRRSNRDSGCIVVGAGAPPPGTHGRNHGADRSRLDFSNYGALIDAQGWGREVTTAGYGDLQGGGNEDLWYTDTFSGTSSASPIIVGVAASLQGMARARGKPVLTPAQFRNCLRSTGSPQQNEVGRPATQRIGTRPNLRQLVTCAFGVVKTKEFNKEILKDTKEIKKEVGKEIKKEIIKEIAKELKDTKEHVKDTKEIKKEIVKEKDFDKVTDKIPDKRVKELDKVKDHKEFEKQPKEGKEFEKGAERGGGVFQPGPAEAESELEQRLAAVEAVVEGLLHFIGSELRPDLSTSALDQAQGLGQGDEQAKAEKDQKDIESY